MRNLLVLVVTAALAIPAVAQPTVDFLTTNILVEPYGVAIDAQNRVFITDATLNQIFTYDSDNGSFTNIAGAYAKSGSANGPGFFARFSAPKGIAAARQGLVVADSANHTLRFMSVTGNVAIVSTLAGSSGNAGYVDGPLADARFSSPSGVAADAAGNIYVADTKNNAIRKIGLDDQVTTVATNLFEPQGLALSGDGRLFIADTRNHAIKVLSGGVVTWFAGSTNRLSGSEDSYFAEEALFNSPSGLLFLGGTLGLLVTDTGNHTIRRVYFDPIVAQYFPELSGYSVETYGGTAGVPGFVNGLLSVARFNSPLGMARDQEGGILLTDMGNHALRRIQTTQSKPRVADPVIGYVTFVFDPAQNTTVSKIVPIEEALFNNDVIVAIKPESETVSTFYTMGDTPGLFEPDNIPAPTGDNALSPPPYHDGMAPAEVAPSMVQPRPDLTIKAISTAGGRRPSNLIKARLQFKAGPPVIFGDNPASFTVTNSTVGVEMWYTLDGTDPTNGLPSFGPLATGDEVSLRITNVTTMKLRAYRNRYQSSEITTKVFSPTDFQANRISLGFERGEASSSFLATPGQRFYSPVTLSVLPGQLMFSLQFNLSLTNNAAAPDFDPQTMAFSTMLEKLIPNTAPPVYQYMDPEMFRSYITRNFTNQDTGVVITNYTPVYTNTIFTNISAGMLGVAWLERFGQTNLYDTAKQQVITYSRAHDNRFLSAGGKVIAGAFAFDVPPDNAAVGKSYRMRVGRPSATSDGISDDVYIEATDGATRDVHIVDGGIGPGQLHYIVGDVAPFRWFNAGDFGDTNLLNNDVLQIFQSAIYGISSPAPGSDYFDAMDTSNGLTNALLQASSGDDTVINSVKFGDGFLNVDDVFVALRRSLDPSLTMYARYWTNGVLEAAALPNLFRGSTNADSKVRKFGGGAKDGSPSGTPTIAPSVVFSVDPFQAAPGQTISVPVRASVSGDLPVKVLLLGLKVVPLEGAPAITTPIKFTPAVALGTPSFTMSRMPDEYGATWLSTDVPGLTGNTQVGVLEIAIPAEATATSAYAVKIAKVSGSPNGVALLPQTVVDGLITLSNRLSSSLNDGISDEWRLRFFGSLSNVLARANADPDGDGVPNWAEFKAGTSPLDLRSRLELLSAQLRQNASTLALQWQTIAGKKYVIESSSDPVNGPWTTVSSDVVGSGTIVQFLASQPAQGNLFYRVRLVE